MENTNYRAIADDLISDLKDGIRANLLTYSSSDTAAEKIADAIGVLNARIVAVQQAIDLVEPKKAREPSTKTSHARGVF